MTKDEAKQVLLDYASRMSMLDIYGKDYAKQFAVGKQYYMYVGFDDQEYKDTDRHDIILTISYIRSGVMFYTIFDMPQEYNMLVGSAAAKALRPVSNELADAIKRLS